MRRLVFVFCVLFPLSVFADDVCPAGYYPGEYVELEYIESTGTQYIDTKIVPQGNHWEAYLIPTQGTNTYNMLCGTEMPRISGPHFKSNGHIGYGFGGLYGDTPEVFSWGTPYLVNVTAESGLHVVELNGKTVFYHTGGTSYPTRYLYLLADNLEGRPAYHLAAKLFFYKLWNADKSLLLRDYVPVKRLSDNAIGMYDTVSQKFFGNVGTGEFIAGPETGNSYPDATCIPCPANTYKPNTGNEDCTLCPTGAFSPVGSTLLEQCARILHIGNYIVYMPLGKRTEHGLCTMMDGKKYCADVYERQ